MNFHFFEAIVLDCISISIGDIQKLHEQAQHRAAVETAARINCTSDTFGTYFYGFHCTSKLRLFLTQFKCKCKHTSPAICHIDVLLIYERCLPNMYPVLNTMA